MKYIDPKNFRLKDEINWKAQAENMKEIAGIVGDLIKETDWKDVANSMGKDAKGFTKRIKHEAELLKNMSPDEFKDFVINGEKQLGKLYANGKMATVRREWRGVKDTGADFYEWARMWGMLLATFSKDLVPAMICDIVVSSKRTIFLESSLQLPTFSSDFIRSTRFSATYLKIA